MPATLCELFDIRRATILEHMEEAEEAKLRRLAVLRGVHVSNGCMHLLRREPGVDRAQLLEDLEGLRRLGLVFYRYGQAPGWRITPTGMNVLKDRPARAPAAPKEQAQPSSESVEAAPQIRLPAARGRQGQAGTLPASAQ